ncbi:MAG: branched-chain amino acid ABC transporter permease, partial [Armatimonadota bacterium]|nr:branched-chain amino acid ABC transporter permease [Armatimonadota bacterium]
AGPILGAVVVRLVDEVLTVRVGTEAARILFGLGLALVIVLLPDGVLPYLERLRRRSPRPEAVPAAQARP